MDKEYLRSYANLYHHHWWWRAREDIIMDTLQRAFPENRSLKILDIGCGDGLFFDRLSSLGTVEGVEPNVEALSPENPHRSRIHICQLEKFSREKPFDVVLLLDVLEHLENPAAYLRLALSKLAAGGKLVLTVPAFSFLWTTHDDLNHHRTRYSRTSFRKIAQEAGLAIQEERYWFTWLFFAKVFVRAKESLLGSKPTLPKIPFTPLNALLRIGTLAEYHILRPLRIPFGTSLLVIGTNKKQAG